MRSEYDGVPLESTEQTNLFRWAAYMTARFPELDLMFAVPNGGSRHPVEARHLKEQGVKSGVPDIFLPVPRGGFHGLWIEMKRVKGGTVAPAQKEWKEKLEGQGYRCEICKGWEKAAEVISDYLGVEK